MKKATEVFIFLFGISIAFSPWSLHSLEVAEDEIFQVRDRSVEFLNYIGPYSKIETVEQIRGIGEALGSPIRDGSFRSGYFGRYRIIRVVDTSVPTGLDADIFIIDPEAQVDHIQNIRRILTGYFIQSFEYTEREAAVLAEFSTYYNAVFRRDMNYFAQVYKQPVISSIDRDKAGISTRYSEWAGNTQMLIPLRSGEITARIDTEILSDELVIEDLRTREDRGIEPRREMVEIRERELEEEQEKIEQERRRIAEEERKIEEAREEIAQELLDPELAREGDPETREREIAEREELLEKDKEELERKALEQQEREDAIQRERERIAEDTQERIEEEQRVAVRPDPAEEPALTPEVEVREAVAVPERMPYLLLTEEAGRFIGEILLLHRPSGTIAQRSVNSVRGRRFFDYEGKILVIAGYPRPPQAVRLLLLDRQSLEIEVEGKNDIYEESDLLVSGGSVYAVVESDGVWKIGRFDAALEPVNISETIVIPYTQLRIEDNMLYVQDVSGRIVRLDMNNLSVR